MYESPFGCKQKREAAKAETTLRGDLQVLLPWMPWLQSTSRHRLDDEQESMMRSRMTSVPLARLAPVKAKSYGRSAARARACHAATSPADLGWK